jgi:hypothetical protein
LKFGVLVVLVAVMQLAADLVVPQPFQVLV